MKTPAEFVLSRLSRELYAPLDAPEDRSLCFVGRELAGAAREALGARSGCIVNRPGRLGAGRRARLLRRAGGRRSARRDGQGAGSDRDARAAGRVGRRRRDRARRGRVSARGDRRAREDRRRRGDRAVLHGRPRCLDRPRLGDPGGRPDRPARLDRRALVRPGRTRSSPARGSASCATRAATRRECLTSPAWSSARKWSSAR